MSSEQLPREAGRSVRFVLPARAFARFEASEVEQSIGGRFEKIVRANGPRVAVRGPAGICTYAELNASANRVAHALTTGLHAVPGPVALLLEPGASLLAAMLGTLKAGRFYIPLDPDLGPSRLAAIFGEFDAAILLADEPRLGSASLLAQDRVPVWLVDQVATRGPSGDPGLAVSPDDLAYVLFTSGSTGVPKGVMQSHRNVLHNVAKLTNGLGIAPDDRLTLLSSVSFGASVSDIFGALLNGASVCPFSLRGDGLRNLPAWLARESITICHSVPSVFRAFASALDGRVDLSRLRVIKLGGEPALASDFELYRSRFPKSCLFHVGLGSTEMNVIRQWFADHDTDWPGASPLGYAVDETEVVLLDEEGRETTGEGEIAVIAKTLAVGYWKDKVRTAEVFRPVPGREGARLYRTGDLGRQLADGCLLYVGRKGSRVKVRGHRVELEEVELALAAVAGVREAAVAGREGPQGLRLVAYVVRGADGLPGIGALRRALAERLPDYMIPSSFVFLSELPRTSSFKVDRRLLPEPDSARPDALETEYVEPRDNREAEVARVFAEVLGLDGVGVEDDFFDLGGSSLSGVDALRRLSDSFGSELSASDLLEAPTAALLASRIQSQAPAGLGALVCLQRGGNRRPVFFVPGGVGEGGDLLVDARLARRVGSEFPFFGFRSGAAPHVVDELSARNVREMRAVQPRGPYLLVGECVGGILAHAMARKLRETGEDVALLALLDTPFPSPFRRLLHAFRWVRAPWGDNLFRRLRHHWTVLRTLEPPRRGVYTAEKVRVAARRFRAIHGATRQLLQRQRASYVGALFASRPTPFDGRIHLVRSETGRRAGLAAAWVRVAAGIEVADVPGDHESYLREHVDRLAVVLRRWLEQAGSPAGGEAGDESDAPSPAHRVLPSRP